MISFLSNMKTFLFGFFLYFPVYVHAIHSDTLHSSSSFYVQHFIPFKDLNSQAALFCNQLLINIKEGRIEAKKYPNVCDIHYKILEKEDLPQDSIQFVKYRDTTQFKISDFVITIPNPFGDWDDPFDVIDSLIEGYYVDFDAMMLTHLGFIEKWEYIGESANSPLCFSPPLYKRQIVALGFSFNTEFVSDAIWVYPPFICRFPLELDIHRAFPNKGTYQNREEPLLRLAGQSLFESQKGTLHPLDLHQLTSDSAFGMHTLYFYDINKELSRTTRQATRDDIIGLRLHERIIIESNTAISCQTLHTASIAMDEKIHQHYKQKRYKFLPYTQYTPASSH